MKFLPKLATTLTLTACLVAPTIAADNPHRFGIDLGSGSAKYKGSSDDGGGVARTYLYYNYTFTPMISAEIGLAGLGEVDKWKCTETDDEWTCRSENKPIFNVQADKLEAAALVVAIRGEFPLTKRNSVYGKVGVQQYDYEFSRNKTVIEEDEGTGAIAEAGWQYRWDFGLALQAGLNYSKMGDLSTNTIHVGVSYSF